MKRIAMKVARVTWLPVAVVVIVGAASQVPPVVIIVACGVIGLFCFSKMGQIIWDSRK